MPTLRPQEIDVPSYPTGPTFQHFTSQGYVFGCVGLPLFLNNIQAFQIHCNTEFRGVQPPHLFSEISYHDSSQSYFHYVCKHTSVFDINEMKCYFYCIFVFMVISVFCCIPFKSRSSCEISKHGEKCSTNKLLWHG